MRIRSYHVEDLPALVEIYQAAALADCGAAPDEQELAAFVTWLQDPDTDATTNAFVITDDDDELQTWSQAGTLEGIEGEIVGYTVLQCKQDVTGYHLLCQGAVHPKARQRNGGRALLVSALNRARLLEFEIEHRELPIYFEALLPAHDPASAALAAKCELVPTDEPVPDGMRLYRLEL